MLFFTPRIFLVSFILSVGIFRGGHSEFIQDTSCQCGPGWVTLPDRPGCIRLAADSVSWDTSQFICTDPTYIFVPVDAAERALLASLISSDVWVALSVNLTAEYKFTASDSLSSSRNASAFVNLNWAAGEPFVTATQSCVTMSTSGEFSTSPCNSGTRKQLVCVKPLWKLTTQADPNVFEPGCSCAITSTLACPAGWTPSVSRSVCHTMAPVNGSYTDAVAVCEKADLLGGYPGMSASLLSIADDTEFKQLQSMIFRDNLRLFAWTGAVNATWQDGTVMTDDMATRYSFGYPTPSLQCAQLRGSNFINRDCADPLRIYDIPCTSPAATLVPDDGVTNRTILLESTSTLHRYYLNATKGSMSRIITQGRWLQYTSTLSESIIVQLKQSGPAKFQFLNEFNGRPVESKYDLPDWITWRTSSFDVDFFIYQVQVPNVEYLQLFMEGLVLSVPHGISASEVESVFTSDNYYINIQSASSDAHTLVFDGHISQCRVPPTSSIALHYLSPQLTAPAVVSDPSNWNNYECFGTCHVNLARMTPGLAVLDFDTTIGMTLTMQSYDGFESLELVNNFGGNFSIEYNITEYSSSMMKANWARRIMKFNVTVPSQLPAVVVPYIALVGLAGSTYPGPPYTPFQWRTWAFVQIPIYTVTPTASPSVTLSSTGSPTVTPPETKTRNPTPTRSPTFSNSDSISTTVTPTVSLTYTRSDSISHSATPTPSPSHTVTHSASASATRSDSISHSATPTPSPSHTVTHSASASATRSDSISHSATPTPSPSHTVSSTGSGSHSLSATATSTEIRTTSATISTTNSPTRTPVPTLTYITPDFTPTRSISQSKTGSPTPTPRPTNSPTGSLSGSSSVSHTYTITPSALATLTFITPDFTPTVSRSPTNTITPIPTGTHSATTTPIPTYTVTPVPTDTPIPTHTLTPVRTHSATPSATLTRTLSRSTTPIPTYTITPKATLTPILTITYVTPDRTITVTSTLSRSLTITPIPTVTVSVSPSATLTRSVTPPPTLTVTPIPTPTNSITPTLTRTLSPPPTLTYITPDYTPTHSVSRSASASLSATGTASESYTIMPPLQVPPQSIVVVFPSIAPAIVPGIAPSSLVPMSLLPLHAPLVPSVLPSIPAGPENSIPSIIGLLAPRVLPMGMLPQTIGPAAPNITPLASGPGLPARLPLIPQLLPSLNPKFTGSIGNGTVPAIVPALFPPPSPPVPSGPSLVPTLLPLSNLTLIPSLIPSLPSAFPPSSVPVSNVVTPAVLPALPAIFPNIISQPHVPSIFPGIAPSIDPSTAPSVPTPFMAPTIFPLAPFSAPALPLVEKCCFPSLPSVVSPLGPSYVPALPSIIPTLLNNPGVPSAVPAYAPALYPFLPSHAPVTVPRTIDTAPPANLPLLPSVFPTLPAVSSPLVFPTLPAYIPSVIPFPAALPALPSLPGLLLPPSPAIVPALLPTAPPAGVPNLPSAFPQLPSFGPTLSPPAGFPSLVPAAFPALVGSPSFPAEVPAFGPLVNPSLSPPSPASIPAAVNGSSPTQLSTLPVLFPRILPQVPAEFPDLPLALPLEAPNYPPALIPAIGPFLNPTLPSSPEVLPALVPDMVAPSPPWAAPNLPSVLPQLPAVLPNVPDSHPSLPAVVPSIIPNLPPVQVPLFAAQIGPALGPLIDPPIPSFPSNPINPANPENPASPTFLPANPGSPVMPSLPAFVPNLPPPYVSPPSAFPLLIAAGGSTHVNPLVPGFAPEAAALLPRAVPAGLPSYIQPRYLPQVFPRIVTPVPPPYSFIANIDAAATPSFVSLLPQILPSAPGLVPFLPSTPNLPPSAVLPAVRPSLMAAYNNVNEPPSVGPALDIASGLIGAGPAIGPAPWLVPALPAAIPSVPLTYGYAVPEVTAKLIAAFPESPRLPEMFPQLRVVPSPSLVRTAVLTNPESLPLLPRSFPGIHPSSLTSPGAVAPLLPSTVPVTRWWETIPQYLPVLQPPVATPPDVITPLLSPAILPAVPINPSWLPASPSPNGGVIDGVVNTPALVPSIVPLLPRSLPPPVSNPTWPNLLPSASPSTNLSTWSPVVPYILPAVHPLVAPAVAAARFPGDPPSAPALLAPRFIPHAAVSIIGPAAHTPTGIELSKRAFPVLAPLWIPSAFPEAATSPTTAGGFVPAIPSLLPSVPEVAPNYFPQMPAVSPVNVLPLVLPIVIPGTPNAAGVLEHAPAAEPFYVPQSYAPEQLPTIFTPALIPVAPAYYPDLPAMAPAPSGIPSSIPWFLQSNATTSLLPDLSPNYIPYQRLKDVLLAAVPSAPVLSSTFPVIPSLVPSIPQAFPPHVSILAAAQMQNSTAMGLFNAVLNAARSEPVIAAKIPALVPDVPRALAALPMTSSSKTVSCPSSALPYERITCNITGMTLFDTTQVSGTRIDSTFAADVVWNLPYSVSFTALLPDGTISASASVAITLFSAPFTAGTINIAFPSAAYLDLTRTAASLRCTPDVVAVGASQSCAIAGLTTSGSPVSWSASAASQILNVTILNNTGTVGSIKSSDRHPFVMFFNMTYNYPGTAVLAVYLRSIFATSRRSMLHIGNTAAVPSVPRDSWVHPLVPGLPPADSRWDNVTTGAVAAVLGLPGPNLPVARMTIEEIARTPQLILATVTLDVDGSSKGGGLDAATWNIVIAVVVSIITCLLATICIVVLLCLRQAKLRRQVVERPAPKEDITPISTPHRSEPEIVAEKTEFMHDLVTAAVARPVRRLSAKPTVELGTAFDEPLSGPLMSLPVTLPNKVESPSFMNRTVPPPSSENRHAPDALPAVPVLPTDTLVSIHTAPPIISPSYVPRVEGYAAVKRRHQHLPPMANPPIPEATMFPGHSTDSRSLSPSFYQDA